MSEAEKVWTIKNGVVGTAHKNREGKAVDFRPAQLITGDEKTITIYPPKGQEMGVEPLKMGVTRLEKRVIEQNQGQHRVEEVVFASFKGVEISSSFRKYAEWFDKEAEKAYLSKRKEEAARWQKKRDEERDFLKNISFEDLAEEVTTSEFGKLRSGKVSPHFLLDRILARKIIAGVERPDFSFVYDEVKRRAKEAGYLDQLKADLLAFDDRQKAERKQQWLAKEEQA